MKKTKQNKNKKEKIKIFVCSSLSDFKPKKRRNRKFDAIQFDELNDSFKNWIYETTVHNLKNPTEAEFTFEQKLRHYNVNFERQVFFKINDSSYFLDFYLPDKRVAIEIDGGIHKYQKSYDKKRDFDFLSIGIKTVRIPNELVYERNVFELIEKIYINRYYKNYNNTIKK